jgi:hypothetical protein
MVLCTARIAGTLWKFVTRQLLVEAATLAGSDSACFR